MTGWTYLPRSPDGEAEIDPVWACFDFFKCNGCGYELCWRADWEMPECCACEESQKRKC